MTKIMRISVVVFAVLILAANLPLCAFADVVEFNEAAKLGASIVDLYGMANNTSLAYDVSSEQSALTVIQTLYQDYSSSASDPYTLAAIGAAAAAAGAIAVIYDAVTGQGYIQLYQEQYISSLDGYWDYQLIDAGLVRDSLSDLFTWSVDSNTGVVEPVAIYSSIQNQLPLIANYSADSNTFNQARSIKYDYNNGNPSDMRGFVSLPVSNSCFWYVSGTSGSNQLISFVAVSPVNTSPSSFKYQSVWVNDSVKYYTVNNLFQQSGFDSTYNVYWCRQSGYSVYSSQITLYDPLFNSFSEGLAAASGFLSNPDSVSIEPSTYIGDPLQNPLEITIPDPAVPGYEPQPRTITTDIEWNPEWGNPLPDGVSDPVPGVAYPITDPSILNNVVPDLWSELASNNVAIQDSPEPNPNPSNPSEVFIPLLPVQLPSFNFSLSGIWHYVVSWVQSLGAWLSLMFQAWAVLPSAITIPVYASAVIVIVLGVYKRFFM